jgi:hypothetical protein
MTSTDFPAEASAAQVATAAIDVRRYVNDEIARVAARLDPEHSARFACLCECGTLACRAVVSLTLAEFAASAPGSVVSHP